MEVPRLQWRVEFLEYLSVILEGSHSHVDRLMFYVYFLLEISA